MKKTKMIVAVGLAVLMVLSVGSIAMAAAPDNPDIGQGAAQPGYSDSTVTLEISEKDPVNLSATVPIYIPLAMKSDGTSDTAPTVYAPTDVKITNTSTSPAKNADGTDVVAADLAITVSGIRAMIDQTGARTWALAATPATANQMKLTMAGTAFGDLAATSQGSVSIVPDASAGLNRIEKDEAAGITISAEAGGKQSDYAAASAANLFKVRFMIEAAESVAP
ncbi:hypothetical protein [Christensenella hongkongensis]|uniref:hypothetical protein n=1 Tax=Christensenella hongkongensis TaxID=270498 RepID=UPI0026727556|nr:hypothetical protein [Christensenella hongkongensis]